MFVYELIVILIYILVVLDSTWSMSNKLYKVSYVVDDNDVSIRNLLGGQFPYLSQVLDFSFPPRIVCLFGVDLICHLFLCQINYMLSN